MRRWQVINFFAPERGAPDARYAGQGPTLAEAVLDMWFKGGNNEELEDYKEYAEDDPTWEGLVKDLKGDYPTDPQQQKAFARAVLKSALDQYDASLTITVQDDDVLHGSTNVVNSRDINIVLDNLPVVNESDWAIAIRRILREERIEEFFPHMEDRGLFAREEW